MKKILAMMSLMVMTAPSHALSQIYTSGAYELTTARWTQVYNRLTANNESVKGTTYIGPLRGNGFKDRLHKNGSRDTIIFIPEATNFIQPIDMVFYFHGLGGFKKRDFGRRILRHTPYVDSTRNYIIVIAEMPWSKNTSTPRTRQGRVYTRKGEFRTFVQAVRSRLTAHFHPKCTNVCPLYTPHVLGDVVLLGHSAGGSTLMSISRSGGLRWLTEQGAAPSVRIIFSDASYGRWLDIAWKHHPPTAHSQFVVLTRKWDKPYLNAIRFLRKLRRLPDNMAHVVYNRSVTHAGIGDKSFEWVFVNEESGCGEGEKNDQPPK